MHIKDTKAQPTAQKIANDRISIVHENLINPPFGNIYHETVQDFITASHSIFAWDFDSFSLPSSLSM